MSVRVVYCNHESAALTVRERLAFPSEEVRARAYRAFRARFPASEVVFLSTCNRVEVYVADATLEAVPTVEEISAFLADFHGVPLDDFISELRSSTGGEAVRHLYRVTSSLDSMVLGEPQIVAQVKDAYRSADEAGTCGRLTHQLFQSAIRTSNRVRSETKLEQGRVSIASVAVGEFGRSIFDTFSDKTVLIIGAGEMAEETLRYLKDEGVARIVVINRSPERAERLAASWGGKPAPWSDLDQWLGHSDVIVSTTGATTAVVTLDRFRAARHASKVSRPVFILDLGAPRDFDPAVGQMEDVYLYDIDSLQKTCERNRIARQGEARKAMEIVDDEVARLMTDLHNRAGSDVMTRLREDWQAVSEQELHLLYAKMPHLTEADRNAINRTVNRIVNKLLHPPLEALRDESKEGTPHGLLSAISRLFGL